MTTPARRQYLDIKAQHRDALLLYQIGDFFECFDDDARILAQELQLVLTARTYHRENGPDEVAPLAGVPIHALDTYTAKLVARGYRVAICEQVSPPGRGLVKREVTRVLSPGTVVEPGMAPIRRDNYLVAVTYTFASQPKRGAQKARQGETGDRPLSGAALAYLDASTGAFGCVQWPAERLPDALIAELQRLAPAETLLSEELRDAGALDLGPAVRTPCPAHYFDPEGARVRLLRHFGAPTLAAFGCEGLPLAIAAAGAILAYLERMNPSLLRLIVGLTTYDTSGYVEIDGRTWRALEVVEPNRVELARGAGASAANRPVTLLGALDATRTAMGARLLRRTLLQPLRDRLTLEARLDAVAELHDAIALRQRVAATLDDLGDLERLTARLVQGAAIPRELYGLSAGLARAPQLRAALEAAAAPALRALAAALDECVEVRRRIESAVATPGQREGRTIRPGVSSHLDELLATVNEARLWIANLETTERERTGIKSLRVGFNGVFGYYIEVSKPNLARVPENYQRKQTMANGERFVTPELKEREAIVLHAEERIEALERELYTGLLAELAAYAARLRATAAAFAQADVWLALAEVAVARRYVRPELDDSTALEVVAGRHPIVEATLDGDEFVPNDARFAPLDAPLECDGPDAGPRILLLTGPNMAGKSTYLRQVATIALMAQIGSFVPARSARIGLVDRIFTRVGAEDDLARGLSTFMLEMVETAYILRHATARSLVILDEVGRGTSTHDGLAIARAVIEHLHDVTRARTLFATHYHELAALAGALLRLATLRMAVSETDGDAVFLHRVVPGASASSYGVQVARMAGLPASVTARAAALLAEAEPPTLRIAETAPPYEAQPSPAHHDDKLTDDRLTENVVSREAGYFPTASPLAEDATGGLGSASMPPARNEQDAGESSAAGEPRDLALALARFNIVAMTPLEAINRLFELQQQALALLRERGDEPLAETLAPVALPAPGDADAPQGQPGRDGD